ncbi:uncharacterized protein PG998_012782 [Apiospora kogelbergensis]|uniref:uncharacterized protein n=1 Tax=Apiospora kogelbergensis TaxID=1337665 RepID=UPI0031305F46
MAQILGKVKSTAAIALEAEVASFGDEALESDRPLLILDQRWKNITPREWQQLTPVERSTALVDRHDANEFDSAIYSKANESSNPNSGFYGVPSYALRVTAPPRPEPKFLAHINPWTHWTHARTPEWHAEKQEEIKARGNRKDPRNFGQAAKRVAEGKATRGHLPSYRKPELPDRVKTNPSWMAALAELNKLKEAYHAEQRTKTQQRKRRRKGKTRRHSIETSTGMGMSIWTIAQEVSAMNLYGQPSVRLSLPCTGATGRLFGEYTESASSLNTY